MKLKMAGNTNLGCVRKNNEDNFCVSANLQAGQFANASCPWGAEQVVDLGPKGVLLVVADGMGGTNAGEVASERAVTKVAEFFSPDNITADITSHTDKILNFMEQAIVACDKEVKDWGNSHPESKGMGTTMVMGWILDGKLYVAWCGDSRAYVYRPGENKIYQVSKDHSYVQLLVDKEMLTREETFDHPQGNIITRSLSHGQPAAKPESLPEPYTLCDGDIVLLCSDGLSGMLHDPEMADIISNSADDMETIVNNLINSARTAGGHDNITVVLCKVENGGTGTAAACAAFFAKTEAALNGPGVNGGQPKPTPLFPEEPVGPQGPVTAFVPSVAAALDQKPAPKKRSNKKLLATIVGVLAVVLVCGTAWLGYNKFIKPAPKADATEAPADKPVQSDTEIDDEVNSEDVGDSDINTQAVGVAAGERLSSDEEKESVAKEPTLEEVIDGILKDGAVAFENEGVECYNITKIDRVAILYFRSTTETPIDSAKLVSLRNSVGSIERLKPFADYCRKHKIEIRGKVKSKEEI